MPKIVRVDARDAARYAAMQRMVAEYEASLPRDLQIPDVAAEIATLAERYPAPACAMLLAYDEDVPVGCVVVKPVDAASAEVKRLYVAPAARGMGAARALMQACVDFAAARGHTRVVLDTERERLNPAYELYRSMGFVHCAPYAPDAPVEYANPTYMEFQIGTTMRSRADS